MSSEDREQYSDFVSVVVARSVEEAEEFCDLLNDHDIPAMVGDGGSQGKEEAVRSCPQSKGTARGVPVLVPEVLLDEASEVIADREDSDEFRVVDEKDDDQDEEDEFDFEEEVIDPSLLESADDEKDLSVDDDSEDPEDDEEF